MKKLIPSLAIGVYLLTFSAGAAFANDLHKQIPNFPTATPNDTGQTGSNVLSSCGAGGVTSLGTSSTKTNPLVNGSGSATGSPFNQSVSKTYAGNPNSPTNPTGGGLLQGNIGHTSNANTNTAVSQYDNACAQSQLHQLH